MRALLLVLVASLALAVPAAAGRVSFGLELVSLGPGEATFSVTRSEAYDQETVWVTNRCVDAAGVEVVRTDAPVLWGTTESLTGVTWPVQTGGERCEAFVTLRPWTGRPYSRDLVIEYVPVP